MFRCQRTPIFLASCFAVGLLLPAPARAGLTALITTNTTSIAGQSGYIDLQFNALSGAALDTVIAFDFATDGALGGCPGTCSGSFGDASGDLLTTVTIGNGAVDNSGVNDFNEGLTFGTFTQFILTIPTPTAGGTADSTFTLSFFASDDATPLLSADALGRSATFTVDPSGAVSLLTYQDSMSNFDTTVGIIPEPSSFALALGAISALAYCLRQRSIGSASRPAA